MCISHSLHPPLHFWEYLKICIRNSLKKSLSKQTKACELTACRAKALTQIAAEQQRENSAYKRASLLVTLPACPPHSIVTN